MLNSLSPLNFNPPKIQKTKAESGFQMSNHKNSPPKAGFSLLSKSAPQNLAFGSFKRMNKNSLPADSAFFRDYQALQCAVDTIKENFPSGAQVLDYACANGEEAISIYALLGDRKEDFQITGIDVDEDLISIANKGEYDISAYSSDAFLLKGRGSFGKEKYLNNLFQDIMEPVHSPRPNTAESPMFRYKHSGSGANTCYRIKEDEAKNILFKTGDLFHIDSEESDCVAAVCFRNAFYHLMDHHDGEELFNNALGHFDKTKTFEEKEQIADEIIGKIYDKLEVGGVFIMGGSINEWVFIAPDDAKDEDTIRFKDTVQYETQKKELESAIYYYGHMKDIIGFSLEGSDEKYKILIKMLEELEKAGETRLLKKTPIQRALERDGKFVPVHFSNVENFTGLNVPTVWMKVK